MNKHTGWDQVAGWYDGLVGERGSEYHQRVVIPQTIALLDMKPGMKVLDVGCGQGVFCRELAKRGVLATGIDVSSQLIQQAKKYPLKNIQYTVGDIRTVNPSLGYFDAITCILAIQNIDPLPSLFTNFSRFFKNNGVLILVMTHPCFRIPRQSGWGWDENRMLEYRRIDSYLSPLKIPIQAHPGKAPSIITWTFHRPLQMYVQELTRNGFIIDKLEEWQSHKISQPGPHAKAENRARREIPLFLALRARKL